MEKKAALEMLRSDHDRLCAKFDEALHMAKAGMRDGALEALDAMVALMAEHTSREAKLLYDVLEASPCSAQDKSTMNKSRLRMRGLGQRMIDLALECKSMASESQSGRMDAVLIGRLELAGELMFERIACEEEELFGLMEKQGS